MSIRNYRRFAQAGLVGLLGCFTAWNATSDPVELFNGKDLSGWKGKSDLWSVQDGVITGISTAEKPLKGNTFLVWQGGEVENFKLTLRLKVEGNNNSGIQYRSRLVDAENFVIGGYQADAHPAPNYFGMLYEERGRGIVAQRGQKVLIQPDGKIDVVAQTEVKPVFNIADWNEYTIIANGNHLIHKLNGYVVAEIIDLQESKRSLKGLVALQLHAGPPMKAQFKDITLETLPADAPLKNGFAKRAVNPGDGTAVDGIETVEGFDVEFLYSVPKGQQGSWVSMTADPKGGFTASAQSGELYRIIPPAIGDEYTETQVDPLGLRIGHAHGLLWAFDSLYINVNGGGIDGRSSGLYRARDTDGDGDLDSIELLQKFNGGGEHGPHAVVLSPDGKSIYVAGGNHTQLPPFDSTQVPAGWDEDLLLPSQPDANGHARGIRAPGGWICKTDPDGKTWEVVSIGYRNEYDIAFNENGDLFTYDSDMEWDMGMPWYRPTRIVHATGGSEFGWRTGTAKWPTYFPDSLPPVLNVGPGSPTGVTFALDAAFPAKYKRAFYALDWTFGAIYAIHLTPNGSSYTGELEEFVTGKPLPVTDIAIGSEGAMYFTIGGRGTQSALYRVTYNGKELQDNQDAANLATAAEARAIRKELEAFHGKKSACAVDTAWPHLSSDDRFIRYAARVAIEHQDLADWQERALIEENSTARIQLMIALAHQADDSLQPRVLEALEGIDMASLCETGKLEILRAYALAFIRLGEPSPEWKDRVAQGLDRFYPSSSAALNRELARLLVYLESPTVVSKTLELMQKSEEIPGEYDVPVNILARNQGYGGPIKQMLDNQPQRQQIFYALVLRNKKYGWTLEQRYQYVDWFKSAKNWSGGNSYNGFLNNIKSDALANATDAERAAVAAWESNQPIEVAVDQELPQPEGPGQIWSIDSALAAIDSGMSGRNFDRGEKMFRAALCANCHRYAGAGGGLGPDLTSLGSRFAARDILESIMEPNKVVSDQYQSMIVTTELGDVISGQVITEDDDKIIMATNPLLPNERTVVDKSDVKSKEVSPVSLMPAGLINTLNKDELLDLMAYLMSSGNPNYKAFRK